MKTTSVNTWKLLKRNINCSRFMESEIKCDQSSNHHLNVYYKSVYEEKKLNFQVQNNFRLCKVIKADFVPKYDM